MFYWKSNVLLDNSENRLGAIFLKPCTEWKITVRDSSSQNSDIFLLSRMRILVMGLLGPYSFYPVGFGGSNGVFILCQMLVASTFPLFHSASLFHSLLGSWVGFIKGLKKKTTTLIKANLIAEESGKAFFSH